MVELDDLQRVIQHRHEQARAMFPEVAHRQVELAQCGGQLQHGRHLLNALVANKTVHAVVTNKSPADIQVLQLLAGIDNLSKSSRALLPHVGICQTKRRKL